MTPTTSSRVRIAKPDSAGARNIFVDGVKVGRCVKRSGLGSETVWSVQDTHDQGVRQYPFYTLADIRAYFDPTPV